MKPRQQASRAALELIERFEGYRRSAAQLDDGRWTIGYGHTKTARQGVAVSEADAEALLIYDLLEISAALNEWVYTPLTQNQFDALAAFVFNIGLQNFRRSTALRRLNEGALLQAACAMEVWRRADFEGERIVIDALVRRRSAEKALFLTPPDGFVPAPSQILKPQLDRDTADAMPSEKPVEVKASLDGDRAMAERVSPVAADRLVAPAVLPDEEEDTPSASQVAADAVTARLQAILSEPEAPPGEAAPAAELGLPTPPAEAWGEPEAEVPAEANFDLTSPPEEPAPQEAPQVEPRFEPPAETAEHEGQLFTADPMGFDEFQPRPVANYDFDAEIERTPVEPIRAVGTIPMLAGVMVIGLILFAAGIFWGFNAKHGPGALIGWGLGLVGIGCVATAVYLLLERLGGREE